MSRERLVALEDGELKEAALAAVLRDAAGGMTGRDMDVCLTFCGITRRELTRRCKANPKTGVDWARSSPPRSVSEYCADMVRHMIEAPQPPDPSEWQNEKLAVKTKERRAARRKRKAQDRALDDPAPHDAGGVKV